jgi:hypothetical protein
MSRGPELFEPAKINQLVFALLPNTSNPGVQGHSVRAQQEFEAIPLLMVE